MNHLFYTVFLAVMFVMMVLVMALPDDILFLIGLFIMATVFGLMALWGFFNLFEAMWHDYKRWTKPGDSDEGGSQEDK